VDFHYLVGSKLVCNARFEVLTASDPDNGDSTIL
jgi:hypothetical protein